MRNSWATFCVHGPRQRAYAWTAFVFIGCSIPYPTVLSGAFDWDFNLGYH